MATEYTKEELGYSSFVCTPKAEELTDWNDNMMSGIPDELRMHVLIILQANINVVAERAGISDEQ